MALSPRDLNTIHQRFITQLKLEEKAARDNLRAFQIQSVLRTLKNRRYNQNSEDLVHQEIQKQADYLIEQATQQLNARRTRSGFSLDGIFRRVHYNKHSGSGIKATGKADDIFEEELAAVITTIESAATGSAINIDSKLVGSDTLNIKYKEITEEIMKKYPSFVQNRLQKTTRNNADYRGTFSRSGKSDVTGTTIDFKGELDPKWQELFTLFQGISFSVKNYSSYSSNIYLGLGQTDYYKSIMGSLGHLGYNYKEASKIFYSGINSRRKEVPQHFYHLQLGYELMGLGLGTIVNNEFKEAQAVDFFIYNDPSSDNLFVKSTAQILLDQLNVNHNKFVSQVNIAKNYFGGINQARYKKRK